jgi:hypothetical protein
MLKSLRPLPLILLLLLVSRAPAWGGSVEEDLAKLDQSMTKLGESPSKELWAEALTQVKSLLTQREGVEGLYERVPKLVKLGVFAKSPWAKPGRLQPRFVRGTLASGRGGATREALSCLRVAAIARGEMEDEGFSAKRASAFLTRVFVLNMDLLFATATEESRRDWERLKGARALFEFLSRKVGLDGLGDVLASEVAATCAQRPIVTTRVRGILGRIAKTSLLEHAKLGPYVRALRGASPLCAQHRDPAAYRRALGEAKPETLGQEARAFGAALRATGLVGVHHALFVQHAAKDATLLTSALDLGTTGSAELTKHGEVVADLIQRAVHPARPQAVYGLSRVLERGLLSRPKVKAGLLRLFELKVCEATGKRISAWWKAQGIKTPKIEAAPLLASAALSVLGQPLGVSQGQNQTCQSARGISLWSQRDPAFLLDAIVAVAEGDSLQLPFEGAELRSDARKTHRAGVIGGLDPVSAVLTPHLDRLYAQIMQRSSGRTSDPHRWANPGLYGRWVPAGFTSCFTGARRTVLDHGEFVRAFYGTFHPEHNGGKKPAYPNPVGIVVTDASGKLLGLHAVSLLRVGKDPQGTTRVYFFNPNGEDRQRWGQGIRTQVAGFGERPGESSLPFADMATRIYAFHHAPSGASKADLPEELVSSVTKRAQASWGKAYRWKRSDPSK